MKIKLLLLITIVLSWSCSSKYEKGSSEEAPNDAYRTEQTTSSDYAMDEEEVMEKNELSTQQNEALKASKATTGENTTYFNNKTPESLADTLYLNSVRLSKKFIKTANLRFKVNNVEKSTHRIEQLALRIGGYIHQSQIRSNYVGGRNVEISADTIMEVTIYRIENSMLIRVPSIYFDSVLTEISKLYTYLESRDVKTEDVSTIFLRNKLKQEKRAEYEKRIQKAVDKAPRKLDDIVMAEKQASDLADMAIDKKIENYQLQDRIDFSTIQLDFYQPNMLYKEYVQNIKLTEYQPNFWQKAWKALKGGWYAILEILIGLLYIWPLYLVGIGLYYLVKFIRAKFKK